MDDDTTGINMQKRSSTQFDMNQHIQEFERHSTRDETMFGQQPFPTHPNQLHPSTKSFPSPETYKSQTDESKTTKKSEGKKVMFSQIEKQQHHQDQHKNKSTPQNYHSTKSESEGSSYAENHDHQQHSQPVAIISMSESPLHEHSTKVQSHVKTSKSGSNHKIKTEEPSSILDEAFIVEVTGTDKTEGEKAELLNRKKSAVHQNEREKVSEEEKEETLYSLIPQSSNVLDSPASRHLITQFEKFIVKEIIGKSQRDEDITTAGTIPTPISIPTPSALSKSKLKTSTVSNFEGDSNLKSILNPNNESTVSINKFKSPSSTSSSRGKRVTSMSTTETKVKSFSKSVELINPPKFLAKGTVPCRFAHSGCKEILEKGSMHEQDHYQTCKFRPLQCILTPSCTEIIPYHDYIPHLMKHFLVPIYENEITSQVILTRTDFSKEQQYRPKWFSAYDFHFFIMIQRTADSGGVWKAWVWMLGSKEEADEFAARITFTKGLGNISEVFPVHSIRVDVQEIEAERTCLLVKDETMAELTNMKENVFTDFQLHVKLIPHAKNLNSTTRQLRRLGNQYSRRLTSEKDYGISIISRTEEEEEEVS